MNLSELKPAAGSKHSDEFRRGRGHGSGNGKTAGKGHVITVAAVSDIPLAAPDLHMLIKGPHHQIGNGRRSGRALGKPSPQTAQGCQKTSHLWRKHGSGKCQPIDTGAGDTSEKVMNIQLENLLLPCVDSRIFPDSHSLPVGVCLS